MTELVTGDASQPSPFASRDEDLSQALIRQWLTVPFAFQHDKQPIRGRLFASFDSEIVADGDKEPG